MNKLLPMLWELKPISGNRDAFGETVFTKALEKLSFVEKLQLACDIVRQTMLTSYIPNPKEDEETMIGDSYTACNVLKHYLELNKIGVKYYVVFAKSNTKFSLLKISFSAGTKSLVTVTNVVSTTS